MILDKKILIIGGTGALGKELLKQYYKTNSIMVFSRDEHKHMNLINEYPNIQFTIGDIRSKESIIYTINNFKPQIIINAAALKHVPICESNPFQSVETNIIGHQNLLECINRIHHKIETLIFISTDKACKPINIYGMCKAISETLYLNFSRLNTDIKTIVVRYGNVLESTGSVIPFFKNLLQKGEKTLPITHMDMTRFFLSLNDAVKLIEWSYFDTDTSGKITIPKIKSFKIVDVTDCLIKNLGYEDIDYKIVGIRKGEKLHEELISEEESIRTQTDKENYIIGQNSISNKLWTYNSKSNLADSKFVYEFLKEKGVI